MNKLKEKEGIKNLEYYCKGCGRRLEYKGIKGAENFSPFTSFMTNTKHKYDERTGKRRLRHWYSCPEKRSGIIKKIFPDYNHDAFAVGDVILKEEQE